MRTYQKGEEAWIEVVLAEKPNQWRMEGHTVELHHFFWQGWWGLLPIEKSQHRQLKCGTVFLLHVLLDREPFN